MDRVVVSTVDMVDTVDTAVDTAVDMVRFNLTF